MPASPRGADAPRPSRRRGRTSRSATCETSTGATTSSCGSLADRLADPLGGFLARRAGRRRRRARACGRSRCARAGTVSVARVAQLALRAAIAMWTISQHEPDREQQRRRPAGFTKIASAITASSSTADADRGRDGTGCGTVWCAGIGHVSRYARADWRPHAREPARARRVRCRTDDRPRAPGAPVGAEVALVRAQRAAVEPRADPLASCSSARRSRAGRCEGNVLEALAEGRLEIGDALLLEPACWLTAPAPARIRIGDGHVPQPAP